LSKKAASITHVLTLVGDIIFRFWRKKGFSMTSSVSALGDAEGQAQKETRRIKSENILLRQIDTPCHFR